MAFPIERPRRLRRSAALREMVRETEVRPSQLIAPLFVVPGDRIEKEIGSLPGQCHRSVDRTGDFANRLFESGIRSVLLFGIPESKDERGSASWKHDGVVQRAVEAIRHGCPEMVIVTDLCFCEYTSHGHCGVMKGEELDNDATLPLLVEQALSHARAGAHIIAPSGMLDGMIGALRGGLDKSGFSDVILMSYAAKFASSFYGPFREAVDSTPSFGDRKTYQMDPANAEEALREVALDIQEGADILMVKPALPYLDIIHRVKERFGVPLAAYNVSGEYSMVKAAAAKGWIDERRVMLETLLSIRRAGADMIITYFAEDFAKLYAKGTDGSCVL